VLFRSTTPRRQQPNLGVMMPAPGHRVLRHVLDLSALVIATLMSVAPALAACDFAPVKQQIDVVLDQDKDKGARFRREVTDGSDSIEVLNRLVSAEMREKIDVCRFYVAEYLAKRGFPPAH
jgi:hypothetical protein